MPAFFKEIEPFLGDGSKNEAGETLEVFLEKYDPYKYKNPCSTVDMIVFSTKKDIPETIDDLKILLIKRRNHPSIGFWAMPGGFVNLYEDLEAAARRELFEETGVKGAAAEQIGAFGDVGRDPRARVITTAYMTLVKESEISVQAGDDAKDAAWFSLSVNGKRTETETEYRICLENKERGIRMQPIVRIKKTGNLIRETKVTIVEPSMIAADHAAIILQACLIVERRLKKQGIQKKGEDRIDEME